MATLVGNTGITVTMDLAFDSSGKLWLINSLGNLYSVNTSNGSTVMEATLSGGVFNEMGIMIDANDNFFLTEYTFDPRLFSLDPVSGVATYISDLAASQPHGGDIPKSVLATDNCSVTISNNYNNTSEYSCIIFSGHNTYFCHRQAN